ncbi:DUF1778 domain-containing protein [Rhizobium sp. 18065]|uniref:type II toxin-antitoxin system TacA family antitoxin n=1 Tax=Rhizobium sp. 18065 TaxID=2681411 RepID=UPI00135A8BA6|nr:DUF1778 domain-containing protein [Rhizobium sp. 18065]
MSRSTDRKDHPISMRLPDADVAMIDRAAALKGRSRTDFVREAAVRAAEEAVMEQQLVRMTEDGFAEFMALLSAPVEIPVGMVEVLRRSPPWEAGFQPKG